MTGPVAIARVAGLFLVAAALWLARPVESVEQDPASRGAVSRLLGPGTNLARDLTWIRFQRARLAGRQEDAVRLAEQAVSLDPTVTDGWRLLASHLSLYHGSPERTPELIRRRRFFEAGLEVARRGRAEARDPAELDLWRGLVLLARAELDEAVDPEGAPSLLARSLLALEEAAAAGDPEAATVAEYVRAELRGEDG